MTERAATGGVASTPDGEWIRIGELGRRVGQSAHVLRAWERRYGLPGPRRTAGGFRLYSAADEEQLRAMCQLVAGGTPPGRAAREVRQTAPSPPGSPRPGQNERTAALTDALEGFDDDGAHRLLDEVFATHTQDRAIRDVVLPCMRTIGERWVQGQTSVAQEHFATSLIRGRLLGLARGWSCGSGPRALLSCPPGEHHDLGLLCLGLTLRRKGWRITYLGADTPLDTTVEAATALDPNLVVIAGTLPEHMQTLGAALERTRVPSPLALAGPGATPEVADEAGAHRLQGDPVAAATVAAALL